MKSTPFKIEDLPSELQADVKANLAKDAFFSVLCDLQAHLRNGGSHTPAVLLALAHAEIEYACDGMYDEVLKRSARALDLIKEAVLLGADAKTLAKFRAKCKRLHKAEEDREKKTLSLLNKPTEELTLREVVDLALKVGERKGKADQGRAGKLLMLAASLEDSDDNRHEWRARAGLCFSDAEMWDDALPQLEYVVTSPRRVPGYMNDWLTDYSFGRLLMHAAKNNERGRYAEIFTRAMAWALRCEKGCFPCSLPTQNEVLKQCVQFRLHEPTAFLLEVFARERSPATVSSATQQLLNEARKLVSEVRAAPTD